MKMNDFASLYTELSNVELQQTVGGKKKPTGALALARDIVSVAGLLFNERSGN
ncbi:hypothetical protein [Periweissella cryptocerci]|uniref:hypothetical protein n=1 Tax=Periweissella cryptocerci TaxID=2506420 RepID=UPI0014056108|nr:hypothetical protein [Periweissella cryptocerci]